MLEFVSLQPYSDFIVTFAEQLDDESVEIPKTYNYLLSKLSLKKG
jgi:hypothetical protein